MLCPSTLQLPRGSQEVPKLNLMFTNENDIKLGTALDSETMNEKKFPLTMCCFIGLHTGEMSYARTKFYAN
jgi:hypothetical protein